MALVKALDVLHRHRETFIQKEDCWNHAGLLGGVETFSCFLWKDFQAIKNMGLNAVRVLALAFLKDCGAGYMEVQLV